MKKAGRYNCYSLQEVMLKHNFIQRLNIISLTAFIGRKLLIIVMIIYSFSTISELIQILDLKRSNLI